LSENEISLPDDDQDGSKLLDNIASPLFHLRDRSFNAGLRTTDFEAGDLQSQFLLNYRPDASAVYASDIQSTNRLGLHKFLQALLPIPIFTALAIGIEVFCVAPLLPWLLIVVSGALLPLILALLVLDVAVVRRSSAGSFTPLEILLQPDKIAISPKGLNLQWSGNFLSYIALVLPWNRIALAYYEERQGKDGINRRFLCLRDNVGKDLRFDTAAFDDKILVRNLARRAPWAVKAAPKILASQPTQKTRFRYLWEWLGQVKKGKKEGKRGKPLCSGQVIGARYQIVETMKPSFRNSLFLAQITADEMVSHQWLSEEKSLPRVAPQLVRVQQWLLPEHLPWKHCYDLFSEIERAARKHSRANLNCINRWLDVFVEDMSIFVVSEHDQAPTLRQYIEEKGPMSELEAKTTAVEMIDAISYLHKDEPLLLKNINPDTWIRLASGKIKLDRINVDLYLTPSEFECLGIDNRYCSIDLLRGTPSIQADIYGLGATIYFLVTGKDPQPFQSSNPRVDGASISEQFNAIIMRAADGDVSRRYQSTEEMKADLLALAAQESSLLLL